jgi:hypothetical protein
VHVSSPDTQLTSQGLNFFVSNDQVSVQGLGGLNTSKFGSDDGFGQTVENHTQVVINRVAFLHNDNAFLAQNLVHEMFHAAGIDKGSSPKGSGLLNLFRPNDLAPEGQWSDIDKHFASEIK